MTPPTSSFLRWLIVATLASLAGCQGCLGCASPVDDPNKNLLRTCDQSPPTVDPEKLDILFVIDNSESMVEEQAGVARELTAFVDALSQAGGLRKDFYVGVVTTSVYQHSALAGVDWFKTYPEQAGRLQPVPDALPDGGVALGTGTERVLRGDDPNLLDKFSRMVRQGTQGSGQETPFEAVRLALLGEPSTTPWALGGNVGFFRDGARLLVVVLSDEDDCSETVRPSVVVLGDDPAVNNCTVNAAQLATVTAYHDMFVAAQDSTGRAREMIWTAIAPVGMSNKQAQEILDGAQVRNVDCPTSNQGGYRHRAMAEAFDATLANLDSICKPSYRETLVNIANLAAISQTLSLSGVPDPGMLQIELTRADGTVQRCTMTNGLSRWEPGATAGEPGRVTFGPTCLRRANDTDVQVKLLCAI